MSYKGVYVLAGYSSTFIMPRSRIGGKKQLLPLSSLPCTSLPFHSSLPFLPLHSHLIPFTFTLFLCFLVLSLFLFPLPLLSSFYPSMFTLPFYHFPSPSPSSFLSYFCALPYCPLLFLSLLSSLPSYSLLPSRSLLISHASGLAVAC